MASEFKQPNYNTQTGTEYPLAIDASIAVLKELAAAFAPHANTPANMHVIVDSGRIVDTSGNLTTKAAQTVTGFVAASGSNQRIDRVVISENGTASRIAGTQANSPVAPAIPDGNFPICQVGPFTSATTQVTNSMITDERVPLYAKVLNAALLDMEMQTLTGGVNVTSKDLGTISSGNVNIEPGARPQQHYTNNGPHALIPSANYGSTIVDVINGANAGAIDTSAFGMVTGDDFTTTEDDAFRCSISVGEAGSLLVIRAMQ